MGGTLCQITIGTAYYRLEMILADDLQPTGHCQRVSPIAKYLYHLTSGYDYIVTQKQPSNSFSDVDSPCLLESNY